ncbi:hypothetical protein TGRUB_280465B, partial [Toxoplasma gondii RUB]
TRTSRRSPRTFRSQHTVAVRDAALRTTGLSSPRRSNFVRLCAVSGVEVGKRRQAQSSGDGRFRFSADKLQPDGFRASSTEQEAAA